MMLFSLINLRKSIKWYVFYLINIKLKNHFLFKAISQIFAKNPDIYKKVGIPSNILTFSYTTSFKKAYYKSNWLG